jgi:hypothetical protein
VRAGKIKQRRNVLSQSSARESRAGGKVGKKKRKMKKEKERRAKRSAHDGGSDIAMDIKAQVSLHNVSLEAKEERPK